MSALVHRQFVLNQNSADPKNVLENVLLSGLAATRTVVIECGGEFEKLIAVVDLTWGAAATLTLTPTRSLNGTSYEAVPLYSSGVGGIVTMHDLYWSKAVTGNDQLVGELDIRGIDNVKLVVGSTGAPTTDTVVLRAVLIGAS